MNQSKLTTAVHQAVNGETDSAADSAAPEANSKGKKAKADSMPKLDSKGTVNQVNPDGSLYFKRVFVNGDTAECRFARDNAAYAKAACFGIQRTIDNTLAGQKPGETLEDKIEKFKRRCRLLEAGKWIGERVAGITGEAMVIRAVARIFCAAVETPYLQMQAARELIEGMATVVAQQSAGLDKDGKQVAPTEDQEEQAYEGAIATLQSNEAVQQMIATIAAEDSAKKPEKKQAADNMMAIMQKLAAEKAAA
jgi:hypothetical protein